MTVESTAGAGPPTGAGEAFSVHLRCEPGAPHDARRALDRLRGEIPARTFADLRAIVTELVSNSVRFGSGDRIEVRIAARPGGSVRGRVGDGSDPRERLRTARHDSAGGIGLQVVTELATHLRVESDGVWFELGPAGS